MGFDSEANWPWNKLQDLNSYTSDTGFGSQIAHSAYTNSIIWIWRVLLHCVRLMGKVSFRNGCSFRLVLECLRCVADTGVALVLLSDYVCVCVCIHVIKAVLVFVNCTVSGVEGCRRLHESRVTQLQNSDHKPIMSQENSIFFFTVKIRLFHVSIVYTWKPKFISSLCFRKLS